MYHWFRRVPVALAVTIVVASLAGCDQEAVGPGKGMPPAQRSDELANAPDNDDFDDAIVVTELPFSHEINTSDATTAEDDPVCFGQGPTVWYAYTPSADGWYEANTFGSDYDTTLGAYTGTRGALTEIACNDDAGSLQSQIVFEAVAGETVYFMVGAWASGPGGNLVFNLDFGSAPPPPPPPPPPFEVGLTLDRTGTVDGRTGVAWVRGNLSCSLWSYVSLYGVLRQRIGRVIAEAPFWGFFTCDGTTPWEVEVRAQNALLTAGPAEVFVEGYFADGTYWQWGYARDQATIRLQGGTGSHASTTIGTTSSPMMESFRSALDVQRQDPRLKLKARAH
jgi:hypothetical protein